MTQRVKTKTRQSKARAILEAPVAKVPSAGNWLAMTQAFNLRASVKELPVSIDSRLIDRYHETNARVAQHNLSVYFMGYAPTFSGWYIHRGQNSDWAIINLAQDVLFTTPRGFFGRKNQLIVPQTVAKDIEAIRAAGIDMDALFIAHEIPAGVVPNGSPPPTELIMPPAPRRAQERLHRTQRFAQGLWTTGALTAVTGIAALAATSALFLASSPMLLSASYDPVLFGLQLDPHNHVNGLPVAMWYYLTHWYWE